MPTRRPGRAKAAAATVILLGLGAQSVASQPPRPPPPPAGGAVSAPEEARLKTFLDSSGGYRDKAGGYYNPAAGTYADADGGFVDNYQGYTYRNGSYKSKDGDFFDRPTMTVKLTTGETVTLEAGDKPSEIIQLMRETVAEGGGFDKDYIRKSMMLQIQKEHPSAGPAPPAKR